LLKNLFTIVVKEVKELVRDPKIILPMIIIPLIMFPLMGLNDSILHGADRGRNGEDFGSSDGP